ncbi:Glutamate receptor ionotropic, delta-2 [Datura stramonium]|uniref:Glutamate receptor ionotropic, delta-2 n=1 Tax=Datura stramonium TaxID=4076 RepID=A0ABS8S6P0_DATST|nr:Glutamate receptor ionotropic, delta-2 [Datura stramonium]
MIGNPTYPPSVTRTSGRPAGTIVGLHRHISINFPSSAHGTTDGSDGTIGKHAVEESFGLFQVFNTYVNILELYVKLNRMSAIAADMFVGRERFAILLLMRLTETVILWLSQDQSFWDDIEEGPAIGSSWSSAGSNGTFSLTVTLLQCSPLKMIWFTEYHDAMERLSGKPKVANGERDLNSPTASVSAQSMSSVRSHGVIDVSIITPLYPHSPLPMGFEVVGSRVRAAAQLNTVSGRKYGSKLHVHGPLISIRFTATIRTGCLCMLGTLRDKSLKQLLLVHTPQLLYAMHLSRFVERCQGRCNLRSSDICTGQLSDGSWRQSSGPYNFFFAQSPSLHTRTPYFVQSTQGDDTQVGAIAAIVKAFQWSQVVIIYEDSEYGSGIVPTYLMFQDVNARISYRSSISVSASDDFVLRELHKMMTYRQGELMEFVYLMDSEAMKIYTFGLWAYDTLWALAMAAERVGLKETPKALENLSVNLNVSDLFNFKTSEVGPQLLKAMSETKFEGLSGKFHLLFPRAGKFQCLVKLRIGVPVKEGLPNFRESNIDGQANARTMILHRMCSNLSWKRCHMLCHMSLFLQNPDGSSAGTYNDLIYQNYDAAIGDITITANRSKYVDFTLPFAEGGVLTIVPITYEDVNDIWAFLKPLKKELWLTSIAFFFSYGSDGLDTWSIGQLCLRGPPSQHVGMILLSLLNASICTPRKNSEQLSSTGCSGVDMSVSSLKNRDFVIAKKAHSTVDSLKKRQGFEGSRIKTFTSPYDCDEALSKGSKDGGISAFYDAFPKGSPLVADVSRAVIELTENGKILEMEQNWLRNEPTCAGPDDSMNAVTISLQRFKGLFAITGGVTAVCLLIFIASYLYKYRDFHRRISNSRITIWSKVVAICRHFDQRSLSSSRQPQDKLPEAGIIHNISSEPCSPNRFAKKSFQLQ